MTTKTGVTVKLKGVSAKAEVGQSMLRQKSAYAIQHLMAAARFSRQCGQVQRENLGKPLGSFYDEQIACVSAVVMLSVASLEANINEHLSDPDTLFPEFEQRARLEVSTLIIESMRATILPKYQKVLSIKGLEQYEEDKYPFQVVNILIKLRNELVHFHPEWHDEQERHAKLGRQLAGKFELSPFISEETGVLFPQRIISHGCCIWAVQSSLDFMDSFADKLGLKSKFINHKEHIKM